MRVASVWNDPQFRSRLSAFWFSKELRQLSFGLRLTLSMALAGFVLWKLSHLGWQSIIQSLALTPKIVLVFCLCYCMPPIIDFLLYRRLWRLSLGALPVFFRKRALNEGVMDYSGEADLLDWARRSGIRDTRESASLIKDVNILSIIVSHFLTLVSLVIMMASGELARLFKRDVALFDNLLLGAGLVILLLVVMALIQRRFMKLSASDAFFVVSMHFLRVSGFCAFSILLWSTIVPGVPLASWFLFLGVQMLASRLPLLPNRDLVMAGLGVALAPALGAQSIATASMFVVVSTAFLSANLCMVLITSAMLAGQKTFVRS